NTPDSLSRSSRYPGRTSCAKAKEGRKSSTKRIGERRFIVPPGRHSGLPRARDSWPAVSGIARREQPPSGLQTIRVEPRRELLRRAEVATALSPSPRPDELRKPTLAAPPNVRTRLLRVHQRSLRQTEHLSDSGA